MALGGMLAGAAGGATVSIVIQAVDKFSATFKQAEQGVAGLGGFVKKHSVAIGAVGAAMAATGMAGIAMASDLVSAASDIQESVNAVTVTYGRNADAILEIGENAAKSFGMSRNEFNASAVTFSNFAQTIAGEGGDVVGIVNQMMTRTADFASVMNIELSDAQTKIMSGLAGETEALRRYGIDVSAATVKTYAYEHGIATVGTELTEQEKIIARYGLIMEQTNKMAGDFANTSDSLANRQRILKASITDLKAELGEALLPIFETVVGWVQVAVDWFSALPGPVKSAIVIFGGLVAVLAVLGGVILMLTAATAAFTAVNIWWIAIVVGVIAIISALVAAGVWLVKHWDKVKEATAKLGVFIKNVFIGIRNVVVTVWNAIVDLIEKRINQAIDMINFLIKSINKIPGINIPLISKISLGVIKGEMMEYAKYVAPKTVTGTIGKPAEVAGVTGIIAGLPTGPTAVPSVVPNIEQTAVNTESISKASEKTSISLRKLESINTRIANGVDDLVILGKSREMRGYGIYIENINGLTGRDLADALQEELNKKISMGM